VSEQPVLYKRKRKPPGSEKKHGWLLIIGIPLSAVAYVCMIVAYGWF